ncbi:Kelch-like protein 12 [Desmophyllum pertusum]|uniref:Kelch-like protein 12 n=1 Tax=Desmophyllum pertusum TaxID=174260 RepID=A0A9W9YMY0_9CNID|nr:Kelch-like protein 12 [Desmophyllum pertusum]
MINFHDQVYAFPETSNAERYDPVCNGWSKCAYLCANSAMVTVVRGQIYAIEFNTSTQKSTISRYNMELCSWETVLSSHQGCRKDSCVVTAGNHLYVIGGKPPQASEYVAKAERFDTVEKKWEEIADMQRARGCACDEWKRLADGLSERNQKTQMINFRDQLYAFPETSNAERYDPVFNGWSTLDLCANSAMVTVVRGQIYAIKVDTSTEQSTISRYNVELCSWETVLSSDEGCRVEPCIVTAANYLYVFGGKPAQASQYVTKAERFNTLENKWEEIADMQQERGCALVWPLKERFLLPEGETRRERCRELVRCTMFLQMNGNLLEA